MFVTIYYVRVVPMALCFESVDNNDQNVFVRQFFQEMGVEVVPPYMIASKEAVKEKMKPIWTKKPNLPTMTNSYHSYMCNVSQPTRLFISIHVLCLCKIMCL